jgi:hypothetical protein
MQVCSGSVHADVSEIGDNRLIYGSYRDPVAMNTNIFLLQAPYRNHMVENPVHLLLPPLCRSCRHHYLYVTPSCAAYPEKIPGEILSGKVRHVTPCPGDQGIQFEKITADPVYFMTADPPGKCLFRITGDGGYERYVPILDTWELDNEIVLAFLENDGEFRQVDEFEASEFIDSAQIQKDAINPCSLQFRQMMYLRSRKRDIR